MLHRLCVVSTDVANADGAGVSRLRSGRHEALVASSPQAVACERLQVELAEGPCIEVFESSRPYLEPDLNSSRAQRRWPSFAREASAQGVAAVFAFPLLADGVPTGVLDVYSRRVGVLDPDTYSDTLMLADLAALALTNVDERGGIPEVGIRVEAVEPWAHGAVVHNATGVVAEQLQIDVEEAMLRLRAVAFMTERSLADISRDVVARRLRVESWSPDE